MQQTLIDQQPKSDKNVMHFLFFISFLFASVTPAATPPIACQAGYAKMGSKPDETLALQKKIEQKIGERALYRPILSTDKDFLHSEVLIAEGPAPQKNMRIIPGNEQYRANPEAQAIFKEKKRLLAQYPEKIIGVLRGEDKTVREAVIEQFNFILDEFPKNSPAIYRREGDHLINLLTNDRVSAEELSKMSARKSLEKLGQFIPDDIILMKKFGEEYRVIGGNLAFPTHWDIDFALGRTISEIHSGLPGSPEKLAAFSKMINGVLDRTLTTSDVVRRNNWFIESDPRYALPGYQTSTYSGPQTINRENFRNNTFFRTERQTMRGLPKSKVVNFSICPYVFPMGTLADDKTLAQTLLDGIRVKLLPEAARGDDSIKIAKYLEQELGSATFETKTLSLTAVDNTTMMLSLEKPSGMELVPGEAVRITIDTPIGPQTRILSLASSPHSPQLEFATKISDSDFKKAFKNLGAGSKVRIEPLRTSLEFIDEKPAVMIAGGIGITPFRSFIQHAKDQNLKNPMWLYYSNRSEIPFKAEIDAAANGQLNVNYVLSQPDPNWQGTTGRITKDFLKGEVPTFPPDSMYYIVGNPQMAEDVQRALRELGVPEKQISSEIFPNSASPTKSNAAIDAKTAAACDTVCFCQRVNAGAIRDAIGKGANSLDDIKNSTKAATGCGGCAKNIMGFLQCVGLKP